MSSHGCNSTYPPDGTGLTLDGGVDAPLIRSQPLHAHAFPPGMATATAIVAPSQMQRESSFDDICLQL